MTAQLAVALVAVGLAVAYIARAAWTTWAGGAKGCGSGCGKCGPADATPAKGRIPLALRRD